MRLYRSEYIADPSEKSDYMKGKFVMKKPSMLRLSFTALITACAVLLSGCGENYKLVDTESISSVQSADIAQNSGESSSVDLDNSSEPESAKKIEMWDILPEIPETDASALEYKYSSDLGGMVVTDYLRESPKVRIPDTLEGEPVVKVDFSNVEKELTELILPNSVSAFLIPDKILDSLRYFNVPDSVHRLESGLFKDCANLEGIYIGTSVTQIGRETFLNCASLKDIHIGDSVTAIENGWADAGAFQGCTSLTSVVIPDGVTEIGACAFQDCTKLKDVTLPDSLTKLDDWAFYGCKNLTSIALPESVSEMGTCVFTDCASLTSIDIPYGVSGIRNGAFRGCTSLTDVAIPDGVTDIGWIAFSGCTNLTSVNIPDTVIVINSGAFRDCISLTSVTIPDSVITIYDMAFEGCTSLTNIAYKGKIYDYKNIAELYTPDAQM